MELDDDDINFLTEEEQKIIRNYQNSKLNIYQTPDNNYFFKLKPNYNNSYEHREIQNNSVKYLTSPSNFIFYFTFCFIYRFTSSSNSIIQKIGGRY